MSRIFSSLALIALLLLATNLFLGLRIGDFVDEAKKVVTVAKQVRDLEGRAGEGESLRKARADLHEKIRNFDPLRQRATIHKLFGIGSALAAILVHCLSATYFVGTSRWCKEVVERFSLDEQLIQRSNQLKRKSFPWSVFGSLSILALAAFGAAADPGSNVTTAANWVTPHLTAAFFVIGLVALAYWRQYDNIEANIKVIDEVMAGVARRRAEQPASDEPPAPSHST